jgi:hypothetical protein
MERRLDSPQGALAKQRHRAIMRRRMPELWSAPSSIRQNPKALSFIGAVSHSRTTIREQSLSRMRLSAQRSRYLCLSR